MRHTCRAKWRLNFTVSLSSCSQRNSLLTSTPGALQFGRVFIISLLWKIHSLLKLWFSDLFLKADAIQEIWNTFYLTQVDIVTGTPGKLDDFISTDKINLSQVNEKRICYFFFWKYQFIKQLKTLSHIIMVIAGFHFRSVFSFWMKRYV